MDFFYKEYSKGSVAKAQRHPAFVAVSVARRDGSKKLLKFSENVGGDCMNREAARLLSRTSVYTDPADLESP